MNRTDFGPQKLHTSHIGILALNIFRSHVNATFQTGSRRHGRNGNAMLTGASLGDDALLMHCLRQKNLPNGIVDFMSAGMIQILTFQINFSLTIMAGQVFGKI
ncbi:MAG: hypothetical protein BWX60_00943 [Candidatus Marinimicrobia bacterium ADurb.Bin030]|nr:MAG: hypothetical protein BWX60_00943 [Candidatus Marinimicrobia bacterium ADurb.Bin030]